MIMVLIQDGAETSGSAKVHQIVPAVEAKNERSTV